jgi:hypothetical protein
MATVTTNSGNNNSSEPMIVPQGGTGVATWGNTVSAVCTGTSSTGALVAAGGSIVANALLMAGGGSTEPSFTTGGSPIWSSNGTASITGAICHGYITTNASLATITLPTSFAVGTQIGVQGTTSGLWKLQAGTATTIKYLGQTTTSAGSLTATGQYDNCVVIGIVANTTWAVLTATTSGLTVA